MRSGLLCWLLNTYYVGIAIPPYAADAFLGDLAPPKGSKIIGLISLSRLRHCMPINIPKLRSHHQIPYSYMSSHALHRLGLLGF
ncbi:hypothetical protein F5Y04DRAFT_241113 [Hypomontagnella monticulosa]|nr:hypothetical protein F5Y04DRAFT_241113 [Hypomontagnella monticulosa]